MAHGNRTMPVWGLRFGAADPGTAVASAYMQRQLDLLVDHLESLQVPAAAGP